VLSNEAGTTEAAVDQSTEQQSLDMQNDDIANQPESFEPTAQEIARTVELETELEQIVASAVENLEPQKAQILLQKVDQWNAQGYGCSEGPDKAACQQYHIRSRIREIDNRMRGLSTEY